MTALAIVTVALFSLILGVRDRRARERHFVCAYLEDAQLNVERTRFKEMPDDPDEVLVFKTTVKLCLAEAQLNIQRGAHRHDVSALQKPPPSIRR